jgi:hypothetical protein
LIVLFFPLAARLFQRSEERPQPAWPISDAIDYIVNDSTAVLKQPREPWVEEYGPAKGRRLIEKGVEHSDALNKVNNELISGALRIWGHREMPSHMAYQFETLLREISKSYWEHWALDPLMCFHNTKIRSQTVLIPGHGSTENGYSGLMLCKKQVHVFWPYKSIWQRLKDRIVRKPRITYWELPSTESLPPMPAPSGAATHAMPDISLTEAYFLLDSAAPFLHFQDQLYQGLVEGRINAWGRLSQSKNAWGKLGPEISIPHDYWTNSALDWITIKGGTERTKPGNGKLEYQKVRFNGDQIRQLASGFNKQG